MQFWDGDAIIGSVFGSAGGPADGSTVTDSLTIFGSNVKTDGLRTIGGRWICGGVRYSISKESNRHLYYHVCHQDFYGRWHRLRRVVRDLWR